MQLTTDQVNFLKQHWEIEGEIKFHRRIANFVYFTELQGSEVVLRLTEPSHRKFQEIESELHWIKFLTEKRMSVANPIPTIHQALAVEVPGKNKYFAAVFRKAPGAFLKDDEDVPNQMIKIWGQYLGKMHRLTKEFKPASHILPRQQWEQDESLAMALRSLDKNDRIPYVRMNEILEWMRSLPQTKNCYGLIHSDLHRGNFFVENEKITAFDFDDSCYHWFIYDMIAPINSIHRNFHEGHRHPDKDKTLKLFLEGYSLENTLDRIWLDRIEFFDQFRAALVYHWIKTLTKEGVFDAKGLEWAAKKAPQLVKILSEPLNGWK